MLLVWLAHAAADVQDANVITMECCCSVSCCTASPFNPLLFSDESADVHDADVAAMGLWLERNRPLLLAGGLVVAQGGSWVLMKVGAADRSLGVQRGRHFLAVLHSAVQYNC